MSLVDEVLARHVKDDPDPNWPAFPDRCKKDWQSWPCESVRLALSLQAAETGVRADERREMQKAVAEAMAWSEHHRLHHDACEWAVKGE